MHITSTNNINVIQSLGFSGHYKSMWCAVGKSIVTINRRFKKLVRLFSLFQCLIFPTTFDSPLTKKRGWSLGRLRGTQSFSYRGGRTVPSCLVLLPGLCLSQTWCLRGISTWALHHAFPGPLQRFQHVQNINNAILMIEILHRMALQSLKCVFSLDMLFRLFRGVLNESCHLGLRDIQHILNMFISSDSSGLRFETPVRRENHLRY